MCKKSPFSFFGTTYTNNSAVSLDANCNGLTVINKGNSAVTFNGITLLPSLTAGQSGETLSIGGNSNEILDSRLDISFAPGATNNSAVIIQKFYTCH